MKKSIIILLFSFLTLHLSTSITINATYPAIQICDGIMDDIPAESDITPHDSQSRL